MMAAALRYSARKICGHALQRLNAAVVVQEEQRRLLPRLIHSGRPASYPRSSHFSPSGAARPRVSNTKGLTIDKEKYTADRLGQIQKKKEDMYSLIADCEQDKMMGRIGRQNCQLLELLSVQVDPKPSDVRWRSYQLGKMLSDCLRYAGAFFIGQTIVGLFVDADAKEEGSSTGENN